MKKIAILLHGSVKSDYRVIKTMRSLAKAAELHLYFCGNQGDVLNHFDGISNIHCFAKAKPSGLKQKILAHSYFCYEYNFLIAEVIKSNESYDAFWANDLTTLYPAAQLAKQQNAKLIYDAHEIFVETLNQFFIKGSNPFKNFIFDRLIKFMRKHGRKIEAQFLNSNSQASVDLMFTVNESLKNYFQENYGFKNIKVLMNLPYTKATIVEEHFNFHQFFGWSEDSTIVLYQGALNRGRGLELLIDAAALLPSNYKLVILGNGLLKNRLKAQALKLNLQTKVAFKEAVPLEVLPNYTAAADIGMNLLETFNLSKKLASPNKLFEYIHAGIPIVASNTIENAKVFEQFNQTGKSIGELCDNTAADVAEKIIHVAENREHYQVALQEAKKVYAWEPQEQGFLEAVQGVLNAE